MRSGRRRARFLEAEAHVFARYALEPQMLELELAEPALNVRALETGKGEPVLLLHGITLCAAHWASVMAHLGSLRCIAIDMPGHGGSDALNYRSADLRRTHVSMLTGCLDRLGLDSAHVIGHSYGAMFALWLALDSPERVRSIVAIGTPSIAFGARPDVTLRVLAAPAIGRLSLLIPSPLFAYRRLLATSLGRQAVDQAPAELIRATYLATRRPGFARTVSTYLREQFRRTHTGRRRYVIDQDELARVQHPVLVVWGQDDQRYQPIDDGKAKAACMPGARFETVPGGHEPWLDDLERCVRPISSFLAEVGAG
jgi:pimeloyl-ACP methyl ester carboxylesterase